MKRKKGRKMVCFLLCVCLLFSFGVQAADLEMTASPLIQSGKVNYDLPTSGEEMLDDLSNATIFLDSILVNAEDNCVSIQGSVRDSSITTFSLSGVAYRSRTFDNHLYIDAYDESGHFEVVSLSYIKNAEENELFVSPNLEGKNVLRIFLLKAGTREFFMFELDAEDCSEVFSSCDQLENCFNLYPSCDDSFDEVWWTKVFEPTVETITTPVTRSAGVPGVSDSKKFTYQDGVGNSYTYRIYLKASSTIVGESSSTAKDTFKFSIVGQTFTHNGQTTATPYLCVYDLYCQASLVNRGANQNKDYMVMAEWDSEGYKATGGWSGAFSVTFGKLVSGSINFSQYSETKTDARSTNFAGRIDIQGVSIPNKAILRDVGNYFDVNITKEFVSGGDRISQARFYYSIGFDPGDDFYEGSLYTYGIYS